MLISDKGIEAAKKMLAEKTKTWVSGVCKGTAVSVSDDGHKISENLCEPHTACHSWVSVAFGSSCFKKSQNRSSWSYYGDWSTPYKADAKNFLTLSCYTDKRANCTKEASDFLVLWMARDSIFSQYVLNRDDEESLTKSGVVLLCGPQGLNLTETMWICKVLRFITEGSQAPETFMTLVKGGADPYLSLLVATHIRTVKGATFGYTGPNSHSSVFKTYEYDPATDDLFGLLQRNKNPSAKNTQSLFCAKKDTKVPRGFTDHLHPVTTIKGFCQSYTKSDGWGGTVKASGADAAILVERVLEWQRKLETVIGDVTEEVYIPPQPDSSTIFLECDM